MLTAEFVRTRVRGGQLELVPLSADARRECVRVATELLALAAASVGEPREDVLQALRGVDTRHRLEKVRDGLTKLLLDRCVFEEHVDHDPVALRRELFTRAAEQRRSASHASDLDLDVLVHDSAERLGLPRDAFERLLFADLRGSQRLLEAPTLTPASLVAEYETGGTQAVLLRAERVVVEVRCSSPAAYRALFRRIKFLKLLAVVDPMPDGRYRLTIDGPASLFTSTTKYGLELAMLVPLLAEVDAYELSAAVRWGPTRDRLSFTASGVCRGATLAPPAMPAELATMVEAFRARFEDWDVMPSDALVEVRGEQVIVPDLDFVHRASGLNVHLELLGHHARDGLFRRVELASKTDVPLIFAASTRLRVREDVIDEDLPACIYTFKGALRAGAVHERLEGLRRRVPTGHPGTAAKGRRRSAIVE